MASSQSKMLPESRRWVASRARGETLEIGVGAWPSLPFYSADAVLTGLDRQSRAVARAKSAVERSGRGASVVEGDAMALSFPDASFDSVVFSFSLCGVPDVRGALLEGLRVLRAGGSLLMADHVISTSTPVRVLQRVAETVTLPIFGEHFTRRPSLTAQELEIEMVAIERSSRGAIERLHAIKPA
jgi:ubiquinone/menaquinone biosynthesis C-methylase UbiE